MATHSPPPRQAFWRSPVAERFLTSVTAMVRRIRHGCAAADAGGVRPPAPHSRGDSKPVTIRSPRPTLCAIIGDHGSGKRRLAHALAEHLGLTRCSTLALDDYAANLALMAQHLRLLRQGEMIFKPVIDRASGALTTPEFVHPTPIILGHGLQGLASPELRAVWDVSVFIDAGTANAESQQSVLPQRDRADVVLLVRSETAQAARHELRIAHPVPMPSLDQLRAEARATVLDVSSAAAGPDVIVIDGSVADVRALSARLLAEYVVQRTKPRAAVSPAEVRSAHPAPGA